MTPQQAGDAAQVPDLTLERYRLGELPAPDAARIRARLDRDEQLRQRLLELDRSDERFARTHPPGLLAAHVRRRLQADAAVPPPRARLRPWTWTVPAALAGAAMVVLAVGAQWLGPARTADRTTTVSPGPSAGPGEQLKGSSVVLMLFRKTARGSEMLADGTPARPGDLIRIGYRAPGRPYGVIVSVDGRGVVTRHLPRQGPTAAALGRGDQSLLDSAYELDDAPKWERFYFVTGQDPFDVAPIVEAARLAGAGAASRPAGLLPLPSSLEQSSILLMKEVAR
jgi:hypothetical protein